MLEAVAFEDLSPPTQAGTAVDQRDLVAFGAQPQSGCDTTETRAYYQCFHSLCLNDGVDLFGSTPHWLLGL